ncbi:hypothetical protein [Adhaeribacter aquaticus]|uniref:hypothetical protein n=1 Tax=Adhaeribacter aquaticus TaxID=299567 RepID=UPI0004113395|nr:hypothetical protein [Adhaeribacter aquaticus]
MKKLFTSIFLLLALVTAQAAESNPEELKSQATALTRELAQKIGLNELEYIKVKNFTFEKLLAIQEATEKYANDPEVKQKKVAEIEEQFDKNLISTLSPKQQQNYLALKKATNASTISSLK